MTTHSSSLVLPMRPGHNGRERSSLTSTTVVLATFALALILIGALAHLRGTRDAEFAVGGVCLVVAGFWRVELLYLAAFADAFFLESHWKIVILPVVVVLLLRALLTGQRPRFVWPLAVYLLALVVTLIFAPSHPGTVSAALSYILGPLLAYATAANATSPRVRRNLLLMPLPFALVQVPIVLHQAGGVIGSFGANQAAQYGDFVEAARWERARAVS